MDGKWIVRRVILGICLVTTVGLLWFVRTEDHDLSLKHVLVGFVHTLGSSLLENWFVGSIRKNPKRFVVFAVLTYPVDKTMETFMDTDDEANKLSYLIGSLSGLISHMLLTIRSEDD